MENIWYIEGVAEYYRSRFLYKYGLISEEQFIEEINGELSAYYTNPGSSLSLADAKKETDVIIETTPYVRGEVFLAMTDAKIRKKSGGKHSIDDIVLELVRKRDSGEPHGLREYLKLVKAKIGDEAVSDYEDMRDGKIIKITEDLIEGYKLVRQ